LRGFFVVGRPRGFGSNEEAPPRETPGEGR
jgi:hypothetical protein